MAIYHLSVKIISRSRGKSVVASAAYRSGVTLRDERYGLTHDYTRRPGIAYRQILAPEGSPDWVRDRQTLWNRVEAGEKRKDAQLAREVEIGIPIEFSHAQGVTLVENYVTREFVAKGMVADIAIHRSNPANPHARVLLTLRRVRDDGFGPKERSWNGKAALNQARVAWAEEANAHFARAGLAVRIDHRTLEAQNIEFAPTHKIGIGPGRRADKKLPGHLEQRIVEAERVAKDNGDLILEDPGVALYALAQQRATFTSQDIEKFLRARTHGTDQFEEAYEAITSSPELVTLGIDDSNRMRFTTRDMLEAEKSLLNRALVMAARRGHGVAPVSEGSGAAYDHVMAEGDIKVIVGVAGSELSALLSAARAAWEAHGLIVRGAALSAHAAQRLQGDSGIRSGTLASVEQAWREGRDLLTGDDVFVIDEAGLIGTKQLERLLAAADKVRAKVVLVGDPEQLRAVEAGAAFRGVAERVGMTGLTQATSPKQDWERAAMQALSAGKTAEGLAAYENHGAIVATDTTEAARDRLLSAWARDAAGADARTDSRLILAYSREEVFALNRAARKIREARGELGRSQSFATPRGERQFAQNDRVLFLRNEDRLGVKSGFLGTIEAINEGVLRIRLDGHDQARVSVDLRDYPDLEHGYAATVHKSQGALVDRTYVLAGRHFDRHSSYAALSRHREAATVFYSREEFAAPKAGGNDGGGGVRERFHASLSRVPAKELAHDYLERDLGEVSASWAEPAS